MFRPRSLSTINLEEKLGSPDVCRILATQSKISKYELHNSFVLPILTFSLEKVLNI